MCKKCNFEKDATEFNKNKKYKSGFNSYCISCEKIQRQQYYQSNKDQIKERRKLYLKKNKEKIAERQKRYFAENKEKILKYTNVWNKKRRSEDENLHKWYKEYNKQYNKTHREKINKNKLKRIHSNPSIKLKATISTAIYNSLKGRNILKNKYKWQSLVGYSVQQLKEHLERQFMPEMTWKNYGSYWHIDHIRPQSWFNFKSVKDEEFKKCWALENLQPLEATRNRFKGDRWEGK